MRINSSLPTVLLALYLLGWLPISAQEVFREFTCNYGAPADKHFNELDPGSKRKWDAPGQEWIRNFVYRAPKTIGLDLAGAKRAEFSVEYWGGHIGTSNQCFSVNGGEWVELPQPMGTPTAPQRFQRTLLGNNAVPVALGQLTEGKNEVRFSAGPQIAYGFDWGFYWIYDFTIRVFYDASRPHPSGEIVTPKPGENFAETIDVEATAESPNGPIARVEFIGEYEDYDWDGDGIWREWQYTTHHGALQHHLGTATQAPWRVRFDAHWLPDQSQPIRIRARITDCSGMTYLTKPVERIGQRRVGRSVRMYQSHDVPERFSSRAKRVSPACTIQVPDDVTKARSVRLLVSTWSGNVDDESVHQIRFNGQPLADRFGVMHHYSYNMLEVPLDRLKQGANSVDVFSSFMGHAIEVNWPGPVLLVEYPQD